MCLGYSARAERSARGALRQDGGLGHLVDDARTVTRQRGPAAIGDSLQEGGDVTRSDTAALGAEHASLFPQ